MNNARQLILLALLIVSSEVFSQGTIDLKMLIGKSSETAMQQLDAWGIKLSPSAGDTNLLVGFNKGIQMELKDGIVSTLWIEFTERRTGAFPFQIDDIIKPNQDIHEVIRTLGKPQQTGNGTNIGNTNLGGWVKWITKTYQLHCEVIDSKVVMVTIMEPGWVPGKK